MLRWTAQQAGGPVSFLSKVKNEENPSLIEKIVTVTPIIGRFIRVTDAGEEQERREERLPVIKRNAEQKLRRLERFKSR
jgi:hypothetical protein